MGGIDYAWVKDAIEQYGDVLNNAYNMIINILCNGTYLSTILADEKLAPLLDAGQRSTRGRMAGSGAGEH